MKTIIKSLTDEYLSQFDAVEINPLKKVTAHEDGSSIVEVCEEGEEDFWSVYLHYESGGVECVEDLPTKEKAELYARHLEARLKEVVGDKLIPMR